MKKFVLLAILFINLSVNAQTGITTSATIFSTGVLRNYTIYVPKKYNGTPVPVVFNFHGYGQTNTDQLSYGDFRKIADTANFIIVLPQALTLTTLARWENFGVPSAASLDVKFVDDLIFALSFQYNLDQNRIYATGMSNGGFMCYDLASFDSHFAAIASVSGTMVKQHVIASIPQHPTPIMEIHGTADTIVPWNGGGNLYYTKIDALIKYWVNFNKCNTTPVITDLPNINKADSCRVRHFVYTSKTGTVELYKVVNGGHTWPGTAGGKGGGGGNTNQDFNASLAIWKFFRPYNLKNLVGKSLTTEIEENTNDPAQINVFPNPAKGDINFLASENLSIRSLQILDITGRVIVQVNSLDSQQYTFDSSVLESGTYFTIVKLSNGACSTKKIIVL